MYHPHWPALVRDKVRLVGDCVAFVVAETKTQARDAAELIDVDYKPLNSVTDVEKAITDSSPAIWPDCPDNISFFQEMGDAAAVDTAFKKADFVIQKKLIVNRITAVAMEPRGCLGDYDAHRDRYTLYTGLQNPHPLRFQLAREQSLIHI